MPTSPALDRDRERRWLHAAGASVGVHLLALLVWGLSYEPRSEAPEPTARRVIKAIGVTRTPKPAPVPAPKPKPEPEPESQPEPEPEPEPEPVEDQPPAPPPPPCTGCALLPSDLGAPKPSASKSKIPTGVPGGVPGGIPGGVPGGIPGGVLGGVPGGNPNALPGSGKAAPVPLEVIMQTALYTPPPDAKLLAKTPTGMFKRHPGVNRTAFCIDERGKTVAVRTSKGFTGDPQIDAICRRAVEGWRFKPAIVGGRARRVCSVAVFSIAFE